MSPQPRFRLPAATAAGSVTKASSDDLHRLNVAGELQYLADHIETEHARVPYYLLAWQLSEWAV